MVPSPAADIKAILNKYWGYPDFRPLQRDIIESVLSGHDTLGLMPTGGGKSITFQVAGLALGGLTLVVTPLVALMKDQVDNLRAHHIKATFIHSGMTYPEVSRSWQLIVNGGCRFLYISPERLANERFRLELRALKNICLVVVDEAHCISQWGYDFRPSYLNIASLRKLLRSDVPFMAVTASATPRVAADICSILQFRRTQTFATPFSRPNISYVVRRCSDKEYQTARILKRVPGTAIVYVRSRKRTRIMADALKHLGIDAEHFHAGLDYEVKEKLINDWRSGRTRVMVSTNAFGMGIDKPDVRVVIHLDMPPSMEEYYQEAGRAGRDGMPAYAVLLFDPFDSALLKRKLTEAFPPRDAIERIYDLVLDFLGVPPGEGYGRRYEFNMAKFLNVFSLQEHRVRSALAILSAAGYIELIDETDNASRAMIICTKEELYSIPLPRPHGEVVLRAMLRRYGGLFSDYVYFSEHTIAHDAGCTEQEVYDSLIALSRAGVMNYVPRRRVPYIALLTGAETGSQIKIPRSVYEDRRERMATRIAAMIDYVQDNTCRQEQILRYFGQTLEADCACCDNCRQKRHAATGGVKELERNLREALARHEGLSATQLLDMFGPHTEKMKEILNYLMSTGVVYYDSGLYKNKQ